VSRLGNHSDVKLFSKDIADSQCVTPTIARQPKPTLITDHLAAWMQLHLQPAGLFNTFTVDLRITSSLHPPIGTLPSEAEKRRGKALNPTKGTKAEASPGIPHVLLL
jgi:hypothetical protein